MAEKKSDKKMPPWLMKKTGDKDADDKGKGKKPVAKAKKKK